MKNILINPRYSLRASKIVKMLDESKNSFELMAKAFEFGYQQGYKAAMAETRRKRHDRVRKTVSRVHQ